ncbi:MAG: flagellar motor protein MotB, partial [Bacillota bacterium]
MFKFFRKNKESADEETNFWISYADIMAALLLMFILLLTVVIFDYQETLAEKQDEIDALLGVREEIISALQTKFSDTDLSLE